MEADNVSALHQFCSRTAQIILNDAVCQTCEKYDSKQDMGSLKSL